MTRQELIDRAFNIAAADMILRFEEGMNDDEILEQIENCSDEELTNYIQEV